MFFNLCLFFRYYQQNIFCFLCIFMFLFLFYFLFMFFFIFRKSQGGMTGAETPSFYAPGSPAPGYLFF